MNVKTTLVSKIQTAQTTTAPTSVHVIWDIPGIVQTVQVCITILDINRRTNPGELGIKLWTSTDKLKCH